LTAATGAVVFSTVAELMSWRQSRIPPKTNFSKFEVSDILKIYHFATRRLGPTKFQFPPIGTGKSRSLYHWNNSASFFVHVGSGSFVFVDEINHKYRKKRWDKYESGGEKIEARNQMVSLNFLFSHNNSNSEKIQT
jgi:hypothetical protein